VINYNFHNTNCSFLPDSRTIGLSDARTMFIYLKVAHSIYQMYS